MASLLPKLNEGSYAFCFSKMQLKLEIAPLATFREEEGVTYILQCEEAKKLQLEFKDEWSWISLGYYSDLDMVGLTAKFSKALTKGGISCNVIAAFHHDHIFVPIAKAEQALEILKAIEI